MALDSRRPPAAPDNNMIIDHSTLMSSSSSEIARPLARALVRSSVRSFIWSVGRSVGMLRSFRQSVGFRMRMAPQIAAFESFGRPDRRTVGQSDGLKLCWPSGDETERAQQRPRRDEN